MAKVLTLWQPYAVAIALGLKHYETRAWATKYRGPLIIHASKRTLDHASLQLCKKHHIPPSAIRMGEYVAICDLVDCIEMTDELITTQSDTEHDFGIWTIGRFAWKLQNIRPIPPGFTIRGRQGLWTAPISDDIFN